MNMYNRRIGIHSPAVFFHLPLAEILLLMIMLLAAMTACATRHAITLKVNPQQDEGLQYSPQEVSRMMTELGYQQLRIADPVTEQSVTVAEKYGEYRLLFQSLEDDNVRVDVHIVKQDGRIALYLYNINNSPLDDSALRLHEQLLQRLKFEYGGENVQSSLP
jgi:major membrane immunogen (membrane-anchored lipoprotein)